MFENYLYNEEFIHQFEHKKPTFKPIFVLSLAFKFFD